MVKMVNEISKVLLIDDENTNTVDMLMKVESKLNQLCEARNFLHEKDKREAT